MRSLLRPTSKTLLVALLATATTASVTSAQERPEAPADEASPGVVEGTDYTVWDRQGTRSSLASIVSAALSADVVLIGEEHDDMIGHAVELELLRRAFDEIGEPSAAGRTVVLSMEMFERDVQYVLDEYLAGLISEDHLLNSARPWPYYEDRYRPLVELARERGAPVVAANAPRRYVSRVSAHGPEALTDLSSAARAFLPPLPYPGPSRAYREEWNALMIQAMPQEAPAEDESAQDESAQDESADARATESQTEEVPEGAAADSARAASAHGYAANPNVIQAQALWDAAMGHAVAGALVEHLGSLVVHVAGSFHVAKGTGIPERITDYRPGTRIVTVVMTDVADVGAWSEEEHAPLGDFVVLTRGPETAGER